MQFELDDWSASVGLVVGDYDVGLGYHAEDEAVVTIEIQTFNITYAQVLFTTSDPEGTQVSEVNITDLDTNVTTHYEPSLGIDTVEWTGNTPTGLRISITAPSVETAYTQSVTLAGLGTEPTP